MAMVQTEIAASSPQQQPKRVVHGDRSIYDVRRGDVWQLGKHRLMCGDCGDAKDVHNLMKSCTASLIFTSPPYLQQRRYMEGIACWDTMMARMSLALPYNATTQLIVNLGLIYRKGEWSCYWDQWVAFMREDGWRKFGWYVWDKINAMPGCWHGRLSPSHEFLFHFNKESRLPNKTEACRWAGQPGNSRNPLPGDVRDKKGFKRKPIGEFKPLDSVLRIKPENLSSKVGHPAMFPVSLPSAVMNAYTDEGNVVFDPFCGSGTTLIAAEQTGRIGYGMEIAPEYVEMALIRWAKLYPDQPPTLVEPSI